MEGPVRSVISFKLFPKNYSLSEVFQSLYGPTSILEDSSDCIVKGGSEWTKLEAGNMVRT